MTTTIKQENNQTIVTIDGRLDVTNSAELEKQISGLFSIKNAQITVDCANLSYISSSGLRVLLALQKAVSANQGNLKLLHLANNIKEVFNITGFSNLFTIE